MTTRRHTQIYLLIMVVITACGLPARIIQDQLPAWYVQYFGDYLWAMLLFFMFGLILRKMSTFKVAALTLLFTYSIEISQLFHPQWLEALRSIKVFALMLGYGFLWSDIVMYTLGISTGVLVECFLIQNAVCQMLLVAWSLATLLLGCSPSETDIKTAVVQTEAAKPTSTFTPEPTNTFESSPTPEPTTTYTPEPNPKPGLIFDAKELDVKTSPSLGSTVGDLDNDGDLDVLVVRKLHQPAIFLNDGKGVFSLSEQEFPRYNLSDAGIKDLNSDGYPDMVLVQGNGPNLILFNDGAGGFPQIAQELGDGPGMGVCIEDIDSDGDFDLFFAQYKAPLEIWFNNGAGHFDISEQAFVAANNRKFALGDLDGDGDLDAVIPRDFGESSVIYLNDGTGRYESVESGLQTAGSNGINASLGDVDGDGDLDILHNCHGCGDSVWINDGSARFTSTGQLLSIGWSYDSELADLDLDGDLDIVIANSNIQDQVWLNDGTGIFSQAATTPEQRGSTTVAIEDFDSDGDADVFFARYSGKETVWINQHRD